MGTVRSEGEAMTRVQEGSRTPVTCLAGKNMWNYFNFPWVSSFFSMPNTLTLVTLKDGFIGLPRILLHYLSTSSVVYTLGYRAKWIYTETIGYCTGREGWKGKLRSRLWSIDHWTFQMHLFNKWLLCTYRGLIIACDGRIHKWTLTLRTQLSFHFTPNKLSFLVVLVQQKLCLTMEHSPFSVHTFCSLWHRGLPGSVWEQLQHPGL